MTLLAHLSLDDLDIDLTERPVDRDTRVDGEHDEWRLFRDQRPDPTPYFPGDFLVRMHDAGVPYRRLVRWVEDHAYFRRPTVRSILLGDDEDREPPISVLIAMLRDPEEADRDHLTRLGLQVPVYGQSGLRATLGRGRLARERRHSSAFYCPKDVVPAIEVQHIMATSPVTRDRLVLVERGACPRSVLAILARDPAPNIRYAVAWHGRADEAVYTRFGPTPDAPSHTETDPTTISVLLRRPCVPETLKALLDAD